MTLKLRLRLSLVLYQEMNDCLAGLCSRAVFSRPVLRQRGANAGLAEHSRTIVDCDVVQDVKAGSFPFCSSALPSRAATLPTVQENYTSHSMCSWTLHRMKWLLWLTSIIR